MKYLNRSLETVVKAASDEYPVVLVTGPRQVGKTTMLMKMMENTGRKSGGTVAYAFITGGNKRA